MSQSTTQFLFHFLDELLEVADTTLMNEHNLVVVFAPALVRSPPTLAASEAAALAGAERLFVSALWHGLRQLRREEETVNAKRNAPRTSSSAAARLVRHCC